MSKTHLPPPCRTIGCPVGFVGAVESRRLGRLPCALLYRPRPFGGSAITVAAVNALASRKE